MRFDVIQFKNHALVFVRSTGTFRADDSRAFVDFLTSLEIWRAGASVLSDLRGIDTAGLTDQDANCAPLGDDPNVVAPGRSRRVALVANEDNGPLWTARHTDLLRGTGALTEAFAEARTALNWLDVTDDSVADRIHATDPDQSDAEPPSLRITLSTA